MTRDEVLMKVHELVAQQQGRKGHTVVVEGARDLQTAFCISSLDVVSLQMAMEEAFGLKFGTGPADRGPIDAAWDAAKGVDDLVQLVLTFRC